MASEVILQVITFPKICWATTTCIIRIQLTPNLSRTFCLPWQEIDKVHSLTLGTIIRLNTEFKSAPDNVFYSSKYCESVKDFQCVRKPSPSPEVTEASTSTAVRNALIAISAAFFVIVVILAVVLIRFSYRSHGKKTKVQPVNIQVEPKPQDGAKVWDLPWIPNHRARSRLPQKD